MPNRRFLWHLIVFYFRFLKGRFADALPLLGEKSECKDHVTIIVSLASQPFFSKFISNTKKGERYFFVLCFYGRFLRTKMIIRPTTAMAIMMPATAGMKYMSAVEVNG